MGLKNLQVYDEDGISPHNLPNQFYRKKDLNEFKVDALHDIITDFSEVNIKPKKRFYTNQKLNEIVIVATDSMHSRKLVWEQFKKQHQCLYYIEARMGAEQGMIYTIKKNCNGVLFPREEKFYEETLYSDEQVPPLSCTARSIIYNVLMIASLICRSFKSIVNEEKFPREVIFNMKFMDKYSYMVRK